MIRQMGLVYQARSGHKFLQCWMNNVLSEHLFDAFWNCTRYFLVKRFWFITKWSCNKKKIIIITNCWKFSHVFSKDAFKEFSSKWWWLMKNVFFSKILWSGRIFDPAAASKVPPALNVIYLCHSLLTISRKIFRTPMNCVFEINCHKISCFTHLSNDFFVTRAR